MSTTNHLEKWREYQRINRMKPIILRLPVDLHERIKKQAIASGLCVTEMIRTMITDWLDSE